jgi:hypothetical protein
MGLGFVWQQVTTNKSTMVGDNCPPGSQPCRPPIGNQLRAAFVGSLPGLAIGLTTGALMAKKAPTYGRVTLIQSAALGGMFAGALTQVTVKWKPYGGTWEQSYRLPTGMSDAGVGRLPPSMETCPWPPNGVPTEKCVFKTSSIFDLAPGALIGLNVGLTAGLLGAYLPNQSGYGPSLKRVLLIDAAAGAAALAAGVGACVSQSDSCLRAPQPDDSARAIAAGAALLGGGIGLVGGILLTRNVDADEQQAAGKGPSATIPIATFAPLPDGKGGTVPGFTAMGSF